MRFRDHSIHCFVVLLAALMSGCSTVNIRESLLWNNREEPTPTSRILAIWSDTVLTSPGTAPMRGFGGRVFFYSDDEPDPIQVDGSVTVYAFDAQRTDQTNVAPEKKFVFPASNLSGHYSKCALGHSYSFWLPWDKVGGPTRQISLIVRFEGTDGSVVMSDASRKLLPGIASPSLESRTTITSSQETVKQIGYAAPLSKPTDVETIHLNPSMSARLRRAGDTYPSQHNAAQIQHLQAIQQMQVGARENRQAPATCRHQHDVESSLTRGATQWVPTSQAEQAGLPEVNSPSAGPADPQIAAGYQPPRSQAPFARTARRIDSVDPIRQSLGSPQYGRPLVQRPGTPAGY